MIKKNKLVATTMAMALAVSAAVPTFAAGGTIETAGGTGTSTIDITVEPTTFSVTVPTSIALNMSAEGVVTAPAANAVAITNNSYGAVKVTEVKLVGADPGDGKWTVACYDGAEAGLKINSKQVAMQFTPYKAENTDSDATLVGSPGTAIKTDQDAAEDVMDISTADDWIIEGKNGTNKVIQLKTEARMSGLTERLDNGHVADVVFTIGWVTE